MREGQASRTAVKVATSCVSLGAHPTWGPQLPEGLAELSERLILAAGIYGPKTMAFVKKPWLLRFYDRAERNSKGGSFTGLARRKIFVNEQVVAAIAAGCRQVVVIGAGLDTLAMRLGPREPEVHFIEIDHPATSAVKARALDELGKPDNLTLITADLAKTPLREVLPSCPAWDPAIPAVFVAEGLLMYLDDATIDALFAALAELGAPGSRVVFTQLRDLDEIGWLARTSLKMIGEPWLSSCTFDQLPAFAERIGWELIARSEVDPIDLEVLAVVGR